MSNAKLLIWKEKKNPKELQETKGNEQYSVKMPDRLAASGNSDHIVDIDGLRENIETSATNSLGSYEVKQHKSWFHEGCSKWLDKRT
jgi:hypothetical protein